MSKSGRLILIVEDDIILARYNAKLLKRHGYDAHLAHTAAEARLALSGNKPDLLVLDIGLPDGDGFSLCEEFRQISGAPTLFLTGKVETKDKVRGLQSGGDYYLTKPYDQDEFLAVIDVLLNRGEQARGNMVDNPVIKRGPLLLKLLEKRAYIEGRDAGLTAKEFDVLLLLVQNEDKELSYETIYKSIWGMEMNNDSSALRQQISRLKKKLGEENTDDFSICNEHRKGYTFTVK